MAKHSFDLYLQQRYCEYLTSHRLELTPLFSVLVTNSL